jgi:hypothetical protein
MRVGALLTLLAGAAMANVAYSDAAEPRSGPTRAIDATIKDPPGLGSAARPVDLGKPQREAQNRRAMSNCLTSRGLSAGSCRRRQPNQDVSLSRSQARNLQSRYRPLSSRPGPSSRYPSRPVGRR